MNRQRNTSTEHDWIRRRVAARYAGLLEEQEEARFDRHLAECPACGTLWRDYVDGDTATDFPDGHLPPDLIASWPAASRSLSRLELELVASHLADCPECRQDFEVLGYDPALPAPGDCGPPAGGTRILPLPGRQRPDRWHWIGWGWAAAATAAALILGLPSPTAPPPSHGDGGRILPWVASVTVRGEGSAGLLTLPVDATRVLVGARVPVAVPTDRVLLIRVTGPGGAIAAEIAAQPTALQSRLLMIDLFSADGLRPGAYDLQFLAADGSPLTGGPFGSTFELVAPAP